MVLVTDYQVLCQRRLQHDVSNEPIGRCARTPRCDVDDPQTLDHLVAEQPFASQYLIPAANSEHRAVRFDKCAQIIAQAVVKLANLPLE